MIDMLDGAYMVDMQHGGKATGLNEQYEVS